jgi:hypothetical protein
MRRETAARSNPLSGSRMSSPLVTSNTAFCGISHQHRADWFPPFLMPHARERGAGQRTSEPG